MGQGRIRSGAAVVVAAALALGGGLSGVAAAGARASRPGGSRPVATVAWTSVPVPQPPGRSEFNSIACSSASACMAVGEDITRRSTAPGSGALMPRRSAPAPLRGYLQRVLRRGPTDSDGSKVVMHPVAERWNGKGWIAARVPGLPGVMGSNLLGVSCPTVNDCVAVGYAIANQDLRASPVAFDWNGRRWAEQPVPTTNTFLLLEAISCVSAHFCVATAAGTASSSRADKPASEFWNGHAWHEVSMPGVGNGLPVLVAVSCPSTSACTATGYDSDYQSDPAAHNPTTTNPTLIERWNGARWRTQSSATKQADLDALSCPTTFSCTAAGAVYRGKYDQHSVETVETWHGSAWRHGAGAPSRRHAAIFGIACRSASCVAVGAQDIPVRDAYTFTGRTLVQVGDGNSWTMQRTPSVAHENRALFAVSCPTTVLCVAVGSRGNRLLVERN